MPRSPQSSSTSKQQPAAKSGKARSTGARRDGVAGKAAKASGSAKSSKASKVAKAAKAPSKGASKRAAAKAAAPKPEARKASRSGGRTPDRFLEAQRKALVEERRVYTRQAETLRAEAEQLAQDWEPGDATFTEDEGGEGDSINVERERDLALSAQALAAIEDIDRALGKIDEGTYGICESCGEKIPRERLKAVPQAALCVRCKTGGLGRR